jgi:ribosome biogenesis GTPase
MDESGLVVARYRRHVTVEDRHGRRCLCQIQRRRLQPFVGDRVRWRREPGDEGTVTSVEPRRSVLERIDKRGRPEIVAANLSQLIVVLAPVPAPDWLVLDRYLCAAEVAGIRGLVAFNKQDLGEPLPEALSTYSRIGYPVYLTSAVERRGLRELAAEMRGERSSMVGQSGVGKSALINALLGKSAQPTGELSAKGSHGRHTTTTATLYRLPDGGELIDSPGVRDFAPYLADPRQLERGFREFLPYLGTCRFDDCRHLAEPGCAIKAAVKAGTIAGRRYASFEALWRLADSLAR